MGLKSRAKPEQRAQRLPGRQTPRLYQQRPPARAASLVDRFWSVEDLWNMGWGVFTQWPLFALEPLGKVLANPKWRGRIEASVRRLCSPRLSLVQSHDATFRNLGAQLLALPWRRATKRV